MYDLWNRVIALNMDQSLKYGLKKDQKIVCLELLAAFDAGEMQRDASTCRARSRAAIYNAANYVTLATRSYTHPVIHANKMP